MFDYYNRLEERQQLFDLVGSYSFPSIPREEDLIAAELDMKTTNLSQLLEDILDGM